MARPQSNKVILSTNERKKLLEIVSKGLGSSQEVKRAHILLLADRSLGDHKLDREIASFMDVSLITVWNTRNKYCMNGLKGIEHGKGAGRPRTIDGEVEAHMIAVACSEPPEGHVRWTLQLIANRVVALTELDSLSNQSVHRTLKKMNLNLG